MLIAWLAHIFQQITKLKSVRRTTKFKADWRSHWQDLRQCEWIRDQILAAGSAQLLAGKDLDLDFTPSTEPPADYGGPCPSTPFEMNRRFLAIARFNADPEPGIRKHAKRIAQRAGIDLANPLVAHESTDAALRAAAHHELGGAATLVSRNPSQALILSSARSAHPSTCRAEAARRRKDERGPAHARGPPPPPKTLTNPPRTTCENAPPCQLLDATPPQPYLAPVCAALSPSRRAPIGGAT